MKRIALLFVVATAPSVFVIANAQTGVTLTAQVVGQPLPLGSPIVMTVRATNGTGDLLQLGTLTYYDMRLTVTVRASDGAPVGLYPIVAEGLPIPSLESDRTATPPGGHVEGSIVLDELFDINEVGDYTVELLLRTGTGLVTTETVVSIVSPPPSLASAVAAYIRARRADIVAFGGNGEPVTEPPLDTFNRVAEEATGSYLAEPALAHAVAEGVNQGLERVHLGRASEAEPMLRGAVVRAETFITSFPTSPFTSQVAQSLGYANAGLDGTEVWDVHVSEICQGQLFRVTNLGLASTVVEYRVIGGGGGVFTLGASADSVLAFTDPVPGVQLLRNGDVEAVALSSMSTCSQSSGTQLPPPPPVCQGLPGTVYVSTAGLVVGGPLDGQPYAGRLLGDRTADVLVGTDGPDVLEGLGRDDLLCGGPGDDALLGGDGADTADGGPGTDGCDGAETTAACEGPIPVLTAVRPFAECVVPEADGSYTAYFGYENLSGQVGRVPYGPDNRVVYHAPNVLGEGDELAETSPELFALPGAVPVHPEQTPPFPGFAFSVYVPATEVNGGIVTCGPEGCTSLTAPGSVSWTLLGETVTSSLQRDPECPAP